MRLGKQIKINFCNSYIHFWYSQVIEDHVRNAHFYSIKDSQASIVLLVETTKKKSILLKSYQRDWAEFEVWLFLIKFCSSFLEIIATLSRIWNKSEHNLKIRWFQLKLNKDRIIHIFFRKKLINICTIWFEIHLLFTTINWKYCNKCIFLWLPKGCGSD